MAIPVSCTACGSTFNVNEQYAGRRFACRNCKAPLEVPAAPSAPRTTQPAAPRPTTAPRAPVAKAPAPPAPAPQAPKPQPAADPNALRIKCPGCGNVTVGNSSFIGRRVRCKQCGHEFQVQGPGPQPSAVRPTPAQPRPTTPAPRPAEPIAVDSGPRIDDLLAGISLEAEPSHALAPAPLVKRPVAVVRPSRDWQEDRSSGGGETVDQVLGILGLLWALGMLALVGYSFYAGGIVPGLAALFCAITVPHVVVYFTALIRIGYHGNPGIAVACFVGGWFCGGLGEIVAIVFASRNSTKWRLDGILSTWITLCALTYMLVFGTVGYLVYQGIQNPQQFKQQQAKSRKQQEQKQPTPSGPPKPVQGPNNDEILTNAERKVANRELVAKLLTGIVDADTARAAAATYKALQADHRGIGNSNPGPSMSSDQTNRYTTIQRRDFDAMSQINREEFRVRGIPGAAEPLGLLSRVASQSTPDRGTRPGRPGFPDKRPEPTTPSEKIDRAIEDLAEGSVFKVRDAVKVLKTVDVDESKREAVSKALGIALADNNPFVQEDAAAALVIWGTEKNVRGLIDAMGDGKHGHGGTRKAAMRALAQLKDERGAKAVVKMLSTFEGREAVEALKEMGPVAEEAVLPQLENDDPKMRFQVCGILEEIGTSKSVDKLKRHVNGDRIPDVKEAARNAIKAIESRGGGR